MNNEAELMLAAAQIMAASARAICRTMGAHAENMQRQHLGHSMAYSEAEFLEIIEDEGVGVNTMQTIINGARG